MADPLSKAERSKLMARVRSKNTKPEVLLRKLVSGYCYPLGLRYRLHYKQLTGTPDIVFPTKRIAIFVDGGFWHGYQFQKWCHKLDKAYWLPKIKENMRRDARINRRLRADGWTVIRIWDWELKNYPEKALLKIKLALRNSHQ